MEWALCNNSVVVIFAWRSERSLSLRCGYLRSFKLRLKLDLELARGNMRENVKERLLIYETKQKKETQKYNYRKMKEIRRVFKSWQRSFGKGSGERRSVGEIRQKKMPKLKRKIMKEKGIKARAPQNE